MQKFVTEICQHEDVTRQRSYDSRTFIFISLDCHVSWYPCLIWLTQICGFICDSRKYNSIGTVVLRNTCNITAQVLVFLVQANHIRWSWIGFRLCSLNRPILNIVITSAEYLRNRIPMWGKTVRRRKSMPALCKDRHASISRTRKEPPVCTYSL